MHALGAGTVCTQFPRGQEFGQPDIDELTNASLIAAMKFGEAQANCAIGYGAHNCLLDRHREGIV